MWNRDTTPTRRARRRPVPPLPTAAVAGLLAMAALALYQAHAAANWQDRADRQLRSLSQCRGIVEQIVALRSRPRIARQYAESSQGLSELVEACLATAKVPTKKLVTIRPIRPVRMGRSDYLEDAALLALQEITLKQLVSIVVGIKSHRPQMHVKLLDLTPVRNQRDLWDTDIQLAALIYDPIVSSPQETNR